MNKYTKYPVIFYTIALLLILSYPLSTIWRIEFPLREVVEMKFKVRLYDPYDPLRGRYVRLQPVLNRLETTDKKSFIDHRNGRSRNCYLVLTRSADGFAVPRRLEEKVPVLKKGEAAVKVRYNYVQHGYGKEKGRRFHRFSLPFDRFYTNEFKAPQLEEELKKNASKGKEMVLTVRFLSCDFWAVSSLAPQR